MEESGESGLSGARRKAEVETSWAAMCEEDAAIYSALLSNKSDSSFHELSGAIAYAQYFRHKNQFVQKYTQDEGIPPTDDEMRTIVRSFQDKNSFMLENLRQQSERLLTGIVEEYAS